MEWLSDDLPVDVDEIGYELYPKNGDQMWESYKKYSEKVKVKYDDELVKKSIERTYDIAHNRIADFMPDNTVRLPDFVVPVGATATEHWQDSALREQETSVWQVKKSILKDSKKK